MALAAEAVLASCKTRLIAGSTEEEWPQVAQMQQRMRDDGVYGT